MPSVTSWHMHTLIAASATKFPMVFARWKTENFLEDETAKHAGEPRPERAAIAPPPMHDG